MEKKKNPGVKSLLEAERWKQILRYRYHKTQRILWNHEAVNGDRKLNGAIYRDHVCFVHRVEFNSIRTLIHHTPTLMPKFSYF